MRESAFGYKDLRCPPRPWWLTHFLSHQGLQLVEKGLLILKVPIDRRKPDIRDLVQIPQPLHEELSDFGGGDLPVRGIAHFALYLIDEIGQLPITDRTLFASF